MSHNDRDHPALEQIFSILRRLRDPQTGCPWHLEQTYQTIAKYSIEEVYEIFNAILKDDKENLCEEVGDLLFHILYYCQLAQEDGSFNFNDVCQNLSQKLMRRHPHIFDKNFPKLENIEHIAKVWQDIKRKEKRKGAPSLLPKMPKKISIFSSIKDSYPPMLEALKLQKKAQKNDACEENILLNLAKIGKQKQQLLELFVKNDSEHIKTAYGELLFTLLNLSVCLNIDAEECLKHANIKFRTDFAYIEADLPQNEEHVAYEK